MLTCIIALYNYLLIIAYLYAPHKRNALWNAEYFLFLLIIKKDFCILVEIFKAHSVQIALKRERMTVIEVSSHGIGNDVFSVLGIIA